MAQVSIQGEQQEALSSTVWASDGQVRDYVEQTSAKYLPCRQRGRHLFAAAGRRDMRFTGVTPEGFMERRVVCQICEAVGRVEEWDVRHKRGIIIRCDLVRVRADYSEAADYLGEKGRGRMKPRQIESAIGTVALEGQNLREIRKALMAELRQRQSEGS